MAWGHAVVGDGTRRRSGAGSGETWGWGDTFQESEPAWYRTPLEAHAREAILWHRRETRRQTENTNRLLRGGQTATEKRGEQSRVEGRGEGGRDGRLRTMPQEQTRPSPVPSRAKPDAQFIAVCSTSILVEKLRMSSPLSSQSRENKGVSLRPTRAYICQVRPSTNSNNLSEMDMDSLCSSINIVGL